MCQDMMTAYKAMTKMEATTECTEAKHDETQTVCKKEAKNKETKAPYKDMKYNNTKVTCKALSKIEMATECI